MLCTRILWQALASDIDSGSLGQLTYSIVSGNDGDRFEINSTTADVSNKVVLDRELQESYTLTVQAEDAGTNSRSALAFTENKKKHGNCVRPLLVQYGLNVMVKLELNFIDTFGWMEW